jgi:hypothetical protein
LRPDCKVRFARQVTGRETNVDTNAAVLNGQRYD